MFHHHGRHDSVADTREREIALRSKIQECVSLDGLVDGCREIPREIGSSKTGFSRMMQRFLNYLRNLNETHPTGFDRNIAKPMQNAQQKEHIFGRLRLTVLTTEQFRGLKSYMVFGLAGWEPEELHVEQKEVLASAAARHMRVTPKVEVGDETEVDSDLND